MRLGRHVISHPGARSGPVNTMGPYIVYLPRITIGLKAKERSLVPTLGSKKYWTGDFHPVVLRDLSDIIPLEVMEPRQRVNTTAVVAAAMALIFAYQDQQIPAKADTSILKDMAKFLEQYIPRRFLDGRDGTRMEMILRGLRRFILHVRPTKIIHPNEYDDDGRQDDHRAPVIKIEDTENLEPSIVGDNPMLYIEYPEAPSKSRKRGLDDVGERTTKRARPGHGLNPRHGSFLSNQYHPTSEMGGMRQLLEVTGLGSADIDRCLGLMAKGMSAKKAIDELGKGMLIPEPSIDVPR